MPPGSVPESVVGPTVLAFPSSDGDFVISNKVFDNAADWLLIKSRRSRDGLDNINMSGFYQSRTVNRL